MKQNPCVFMCSEQKLEEKSTKKKNKWIIHYLVKENCLKVFPITNSAQGWGIMYKHTHPDTRI